MQFALDRDCLFRDTGRKYTPQQRRRCSGPMALRFAGRGSAASAYSTKGFAQPVIWLRIQAAR